MNAIATLTELLKGGEITEERIEKLAENAQDSLDRRYLSTAMTQLEYEYQTYLIDQWAEDAYLRLK